MANIKFQYDETKEYYDINAVGGKLERTEGLDSAILMSLFVNQRADSSEQPIKELQSGWQGNIIVNDIPDYEIGCRQWIYINQGRTTQEVAEEIKDTVKNDGLQWLIDDGYAQEINVQLELDQKIGKITLTFDIKIDENNTEKKKVILWNNTQNP